MDKNDKVWFDKAMRVILAASAGWFQPTKDVIANYWQAVSGYALEEVREGMGAISRTYTKGHISPADLRAAVEIAHAAALREQEFSDNRQTKPVDPRGLQFAKMKGAAAPMFSRRLLGMDNLPVTIGRAIDEYTGSFNYAEMVNAVPIPNGLDLRKTGKVWEQLFRVLEYEWDQYAKTEKQP